MHRGRGFQQHSREFFQRSAGCLLLCRAERKLASKVSWVFVSENGRMELYKYTCFSQLDRPCEKAEQNQAVNMWSLALTSHLAHQVRARVAEVELLLYKKQYVLLYISIALSLN